MKAGRCCGGIRGIAAARHLLLGRLVAGVLEHHRLLLETDVQLEVKKIKLVQIRILREEGQEVPHKNNDASTQGGGINTRSHTHTHTHTLSFSPSSGSGFDFYVCSATAPVSYPAFIEEPPQ